jgi:hypothetical protein
MEKENKVDKTTYWYERMKKDSERLSEEQKLGLLKAVLSNYCELTPEELEVFLVSELPSAADPELLLKYSQAEKKVAEYYSAGWPDKDTLRYKKQLRQREGFIRDFRTSLTGIYTSEEADEILSYSDINNDAFVAMTLFGGSKLPMFRRVRNAYLPYISTFLTGNITREGKLIDMQDSTHVLFDGPGDAVSQVERIVGIKPKK